MPTNTWNGKLLGVGNRGTAGLINYAAMRRGLAQGYSTASTDTGHASSTSYDSSWALGRPDLVADFGYRGVHVTTVNAKLIGRAFYGNPPAYSYFAGCSAGGRQALMQAQRYPADYDGIIAGAPANNWTRLYAGAHLWYALATLKDPESYIPAAKAALLGDAVTAACDPLDGIVDGVLDDPRKCKFNPWVLACKAGQDPSTCYTQKQAKAINDIWTGVSNSRGDLIHPPLVPGGESGPRGWAAWVTGTTPFSGLHWLNGDGFFRYQVFENPNFNTFNFDFDADLDFALAKVGPILDATDPDLQPFKQRNGKLLMYHGWSDPAISPLNTIDYYESVVSALQRQDQTRDEAAQDVREFVRLFMVPGMQHCSGGPGPNAFDMLAPLATWVEQGGPPERIIASLVANDVVTRTRPLCPYPEVAVYGGSGSTDDAVNFVCGAPPAQDAQTGNPPPQNTQTGSGPPQNPQTPEAPPQSAANHAPVWQPISTIEFVEGVPAIVSVQAFVLDPDSDPLVIMLASGALLPGLTWNPADYTIVYDGRALGASDNAPIVVDGLVFTADDGKP